ncbi:partial glycine C-acetyltransferase, partial [Myxococcaceae bacterium]
MNLDEHAEQTLTAIRSRGTHRSLRVVDGPQGPRMRIRGSEVLLFAGSNSLDLAHHPEVVEASVRAAREYGCAAGGSRLISGNHSLHERLEEELAEHLGAESALVFATGYMANVGILPALVAPGDLLVSDSLNHASIVDGCRLSRADVRVFPHADTAALEAILAAEAASRRRILLVADGVYSMDGDVAPLAEMARLARRHGAIFVLDDAHGTGTLGKNGRGSAEHAGVEDGIDAIVGTLGKSLGSFGAFVAGSRSLRELLVNTARSFIFSCALSPPQVEAARAA